MNLRIFIVLLSLFNLLNTQPKAEKMGAKKEEKINWCKNAQECADKNNPCQCWCSVKCGPREKSKTKAQHLAADPSYPKMKDGICYCAKRDWDKRKECGEKLENAKIK